MKVVLALPPQLQFPPLMAQLHVGVCLIIHSSLLLFTVRFAEAVDYVEMSKNFYIAYGERKCFNISIVDNTIFEPQESFSVKLTSFAVTVPNLYLSPTTITIKDDDGE